jgi:hypothetical protein
VIAMRLPSTQSALFVALLSLGVPACGDDAPPPEDSAKEAPKPKAEGEEAPAAKPSKKKGKGGEEEETTRGKGSTISARAFRDTDFVESESNRDPFRSTLGTPKAVAASAADQRPVLMPNTPIDSVRLIAIVTGISQPRAMMVDEKGVGYVATRGDFVGQAEVVQSGAAENLPVTLNWRVDRIRENEVVLAREDPTGPNRPPLTKVLALHTEEEKEASQPIRSDG